MKEVISQLIADIKDGKFTKEEKAQLLDQVLELAVMVNKIKPFDGTSDNPPHKPPNP